MAPSSRMAVRLAKLPHDALVQLFTHDALAEFAAQACADSPAVAARAEAVLAAHQPVPQWAVEGVLLSSDLVPHVLAPLESEDGAAAAACSAWAAGWRATAEGRRRLKQVPFSFPQELLGESTLELAVIGGEEGRLVAENGMQLRVLDRSMNTLCGLEQPWINGLAADEQSIFVTNTRVCRFSPDELYLAPPGLAIPAAAYQEWPISFIWPTPAPGGLLFCVALNGEQDENERRDEIVALDALTLQVRHRFGQELLSRGQGMAVGGDELFVCDCYNDRLQVFSFAGEHRRSITGAWKKPVVLHFVRGRLYLIELDEADGDQLCGRRIFVLSPQGDTLQVFMHPEGLLFDRICGFDGKLLVTYRAYVEDGDGERHLEVAGVMGLRGL